MLPPFSRKINLVQESVDVKGRKICRSYIKVVRVVENQMYGNGRRTDLIYERPENECVLLEMSVPIYYPLRCENTKDRHLKNSCSKNLKNA